MRNLKAQTLQQVMTDLGRGYKNFFKQRAAHPIFKKKGKSAESFRFPDAKQCTFDESNSRLKLPKLGWIRYRKSRDIEGVIKNITISCVAEKWYASIQTERDFATLSDGTRYEPINALRKNTAKLTKYQRSLSRKIKFRSNLQKQKQKIAMLHQKIAHIR